MISSLAMAPASSWYSTSSSVVVRVEKATSEFLTGPDWPMNIDICDIINSNRWVAKDVLKSVKKRLQNKNPKVQLLSLTMDTHVRDKILVLIDSWQEAFGGPGGKYPQYYWAYQELKLAGVGFPPRSYDTAPIFTPPVSHLVQSPPRIEYGMPSNSSTRHDGNMVGEMEKLSLSAISSMGGIVDLLAEMLQAVNPGDRSAVKDEVIVDLVERCRGNQKKLIDMLTATRDNGLLEQGLYLNDILQSVLAKHDAIASGTALPNPVEDIKHPTTESREGGRADTFGTREGVKVDRSGTREGVRADTFDTREGARVDTFDIREGGRADKSDTREGGRVDTSVTREGGRADKSDTREVVRVDTSITRGEGGREGGRADKSDTREVVRVDTSGTREVVRVDTSGTREGGRADTTSDTEADAKSLVPVSASHLDDEEEDGKKEDCVELVQRRSKTRPAAPREGEGEPSDPAMSALIVIDPPEPTKATKEQEIIEQLSITLASSMPPDTPETPVPTSADQTMNQTAPVSCFNPWHNPHTPHSYPAHQSQAFNSYIAPWAQPQPQPQMQTFAQPQFQLQPQSQSMFHQIPQSNGHPQFHYQSNAQFPQNSSAYTPPPWAPTPGYYSQSNQSFTPLYMYSTPQPATTSSTPFAPSSPHPANSFPAMGNTSPGLNGNAQVSATTGPSSPEPKPFIPSYRLFEDLHVWGNGEQNPRTTGNNPAYNLFGANSHNIIDLRK
nr:TOM1-like protein 6 [Ipomoea batatas]